MGSPVDGPEPMEHVSMPEASVTETPSRKVEANHDLCLVPTGNYPRDEGLRYFLESGSDSGLPKADL
jgi:hypothetical protein